MAPYSCRWIDAAQRQGLSLAGGASQGDRVIDAGCGFGDTAIQLARLVGPTGSVLAVDCCDGFLEYGRRMPRPRALRTSLSWKRTCRPIRFEPVHDFCFSRFGTQFFENPVAGLRNMRKSLRPGGTMTMIVWRGINENPWLGHAKQIVLQYLPPPGENAQTCGPGPFSMADTGVVTKQLEIAGYKDIAFEQIDAQVFVGKDLDDAVGFPARDWSGRRGLPRGRSTGRTTPR